MPPDNAATVAPGTDVSFPQDGPNSGVSAELIIDKTTTINSILTVRNPAGNAAALTITPLAGGTSPVSAHLVITQIA